MPTVTWLAAREEISRELGFVKFTSDDITNTTVVDAALENQFDEDDYFIAWHMFIEAGTNAGLIRRVSDYAANGGTLTHKGVNLTADATARGCALYRFHPVRLQDHFNHARQALFPSVSIIRDTQTIVTGQQQRLFTLPTTIRQVTAVYMGNRTSANAVPENVLTNEGFETWTNATTPGDWTVAGTGASANQEQQTTSPKNYAVLEGSNSCRFVVGATAVASLLQSVDLSAGSDIGVEGMEVNFSIWVYCLTASRISARVSGTNVVSTPVTGTAHGGTGWELLTVSANLNQAATGFDVGVDATSGATIGFYCDEAICTVGQSEVVDREWEPVHDWLWVPPVAGASNGGTIELRVRPTEQRRLRILGRAMISGVSADTDTFELDGDLLSPLYDKTKEYAAQEMALDGPVEGRPYWEGKAREFAERVDSVIQAGHFSVMPNPRVRIPDMVN